MSEAAAVEPEVVAAIRFADTICEHYFDVVRRLEKSARRIPFGGYQVEEPDLGLLCGEAEQTLSSLRDSLATARRHAAGGDRPASTPAAVAPAPEGDFRKLSDEIRTRIGLDDALAARRAIAKLKSDWPGVDWSAGHAEADVDLFAGRRKKAIIAGAVVVAGAAVLAIVNPYAALGVLMMIPMGYVWWIAIVRPRMRRLGM